MDDMQMIGRTLALVGLGALLLSGVCQCILTAAYYSEKSKGGYGDLVAYMFKNPGSFFTYLFKELDPSDWRKKLVIPWLVLFCAAIVLLIVGAALDPTS